MTTYGLLQLCFLRDNAEPVHQVCEPVGRGAEREEQLVTTDQQKVSG